MTQSLKSKYLPELKSIREKASLKEEFEKQKKSIMQEVDEYKYKSYNVLNDNANLKKKIKNLNNTILDRDIEIKTHKQDKEKYMSEIVDLKVKVKQAEKDLQDQKEKFEELHKEDETQLAKAKVETQSISAQYLENMELIQNYKKFVKDMSGVIKILIKGTSEAIDNTKDKPELNTKDNEWYKTLLEHKVMLLKVERKILFKRQAGFKIPNTKAHPAIKVGYSEDEHTTTDEHSAMRMDRKRVKISE